MTTFRMLSELPVSAPEAFAWHGRPGATLRLTPPWLPLRGAQSPVAAEPLVSGVRLRPAPGTGLLGGLWELERTAVEPGRQFVDVQRHGPFWRWVHTHRFVPRGDAACLLEDTVDCTLAPWRPGGWALPQALQRTFALRHARTAHDLARHARYGGHAPLTVVVSGASGLVGRRLCAFLAAGGHSVRRLVRPGSPGAGSGDALDRDAIAWDPARGQLDATALEGVDAVVHLGGANLAGARWSEARKRELWASRVESTALLARALAGLAHPPRVLVTASAIGYYGDRGDTPLDEDAPRGDGFLAELCEAWEASAEPAWATGIRTVHVRTGLVIAGEGGVLPRLAPLFAAGVGGPLGSGRQRMSWIALEDLLTVFQRALLEDGWHGPINAVAPDAPDNREFTRALAHILRRPAPWRVPAWAIRLALGQLGREALLAGQRVVPARLQAAGFPWRLPSLEDALAEELGRAPRTGTTA